MSDTITALTGTVRGRVIVASDPDYDEARAVYNAMYDRRPHAVVQCTDSADVMAVIAAARDRGVDLAIRGGGHSVPGFGTVDDGLVIDLSPIRGVRVDPGGAQQLQLVVEAKSLRREPAGPREGTDREHVPAHPAVLPVFRHRCWGFTEGEGQSGCFGCGGPG